MLTTTNRQARGWESGDWTGVIFNEYLDINHIHESLLCILKGQMTLCCLGGGEIDGFSRQKNEIRGT